MAGLAGGADAAYIPEESFGIQELMKDLDIMAFKMDKGNIYRGLILRNELANKNYDTDFLFRYEYQLRYLCLHDLSNLDCTVRRARISLQFAKTSSVTCSREATPPPLTGMWPPRWQPRQSTGCVSSSTPAPPETVSGHGSQCWSRGNCQGTGTVHAEEPSTATLLGMRTRTYMFQPVAQIKLETDFQFR